MNISHATCMAATLALASPCAASLSVHIGFDDPVPNGETLYFAENGTIWFHDLTGEGFSPTGPGGGLMFIQEPGLESGVRTRDNPAEDPAEMLIEFINCPFLNIGFGFAVNSASGFVEDAVRLTLYDSDWGVISDTWHSASGMPYAENSVFVDIGGFRYATLNFRDDVRPDQAFDRYIIDNVISVPEPSTWVQMIAGFGLLGLSLRKKRAGLRKPS